MASAWRAAKSCPRSEAPAWIPARPEPIAQLHVLVGPVVALVVVEQLLVPEVQGLLDLVGRHHVPRDAPPAQVVERRSGRNRSITCANYHPPEKGPPPFAVYSVTPVR